MTPTAEDTLIAVCVGWLTPSELDREHWRWLRWKPQRGGWNQALWIEVQGEWFRAAAELGWRARL